MLRYEPAGRQAAEPAVAVAGRLAVAQGGAAAVGRRAVVLETPAVGAVAVGTAAVGTAWLAGPASSLAVAAAQAAEV